MTVQVVTEFIGGATVKTTAYIYDEDDKLADPTTAKITITDADATAQVSAASMTKSETGVYEYYYNSSAPSADERWTILVTVEDGTGAGKKTSYGTGSFKLKA